MASRSLSSLPELQALVQGARLDEPLYELLAPAETREELRKVLLETYFAPDIRSQLMSIDPSKPEHATPRRQIWWVNQGDTYTAERDGGYLWAPKAGKDGRVHAHHANVAQLSPGDIVLHYSKGALRAVSEVRAAPVEAERPVELPGLWDPEGYLVWVTYHELTEPVFLGDINLRWRHANAGPFTQQGSVKQGYLYLLSDPFLHHTLTLFEQESGAAASHTDDEVALALYLDRLHPLTEDFIQRLMDRLIYKRPLLLQSRPSGYEEPTWEHISARIRGQGLKVGERTLRRYHVALQTRGFVLLSGVSGTGKTWLTEAYARAIGAKYLLVPVAPNWTTNEDLLGFYNLISGLYQDTAFSYFLREAAAEYAEARAAERQPKPYHLALDEMNLARVEYYFARFLSAMEIRARGQEAYVELGPGEYVLLGPNVFFVGTINVDETTHGFADKVYDRAQLIELVHQG